MMTIRELESKLRALESDSESGMLYMTLDNGRNVKINCGSQDGMISLIKDVLQNKNNPYRKYFKHAVKGHQDQGQLVLMCRAVIQSMEMLDIENHF